MIATNCTNAFTVAWKLHSLGYSVIPSGGGETHKLPLVKWQQYQTRKSTEDELENWQQELHPKLWGIVTGYISGLVVIDADTLEARSAFETELGQPHVITPRGGAHWYFQHPGHPVKTVVGILPSVDIRGDGGFVNTVGTRPDGEYQILTLPAPDNLIPWARLPERLRAAMNGSRPSVAVGEAISAVIPEGQRNHHLASLAGTMRRRGMSQSAIEAALLEVNQTQCQPPLPEKEVTVIARSVSRYEAKPVTPPDSSDVTLRLMSDIKAEAVSWLWKPFIPISKVTLMEGDPGIGKSWVSLAIATAVSLGKGLPGQEISEPANVVLASAEDGLGDTIRPRLDAMGADVSRIYAIDGAITLDDVGFTLLEGYLESVSPALLIIDPLVAFMGAAMDIHRANETRSVMARLARLAEKYSIAILAVRHLTKSSMSKAIYRGLGSIDITAACRSVLMAGCDPENPQNKALVHIKSNLAPTGASIGYELKEGGFYWTGVSNLTAAQILASENDAGTSAGDEAADFLRNELREGPVDASQVWRDARDMGLSESTIKRTKAMLGVITQRQSDTGGKKGGGKWTWGLPDPGAQPDQGYQGGVYKSLTPLIPSSFESTTMSNPDEPLDPPPEVMNLGYQGNLNCVKGTGGCKLRTAPDNPFDCAFSPKNCQFLLKRGGDA
jgi:hypothetical protein